MKKELVIIMATMPKYLSDLDDYSERYFTKQSPKEIDDYFKKIGIIEKKSSKNEPYELKYNPTKELADIGFELKNSIPLVVVSEDEDGYEHEQIMIDYYFYRDVQ